MPRLRSSRSTRNPQTYFMAGPSSSLGMSVKGTWYFRSEISLAFSSNCTQRDKRRVAPRDVPFCKIQYESDPLVTAHNCTLGNTVGSVVTLCPTRVKRKARYPGLGVYAFSNSPKFEHRPLAVFRRSAGVGSLLQRLLRPNSVQPVAQASLCTPVCISNHPNTTSIWQARLCHRTRPSICKRATSPLQT